MNTVKNDEEERIRQRAFELWEEAGRPEGKEYTHWIRARREIAEENARETDEETDAGDLAQTSGAKPPADDGGKVIHSDRFGRKRAQPKKPLDERDIDTQLDDPE